MANVAFIHTRAGSKRCPGKNTRLIGGKPLIAHTIEQAMAHPLIDSVVVSTDDHKSANIASDYNVETLIRPSRLTTDDAKEFLSWKYAVEKYNMDVFVNLPCTCPFRSNEDISKVVMFVAQGDSSMAFTVKKSREHRLPSNTGGLPYSGEHVVVGSCYAATPGYIREHLSIFSLGLYTTVLVDDERSLDIDTEYDFEIARLLMGARGPVYHRPQDAPGFDGTGSAFNP